MNAAETTTRLVIIGGSDAGIAAALRARELDPTTDVTVVVADAYPNFSICGIPYYVSGEVGHWTRLAHRTRADLEATGMRLLLDTRATDIHPADQTVRVEAADGSIELLGYDALVVGTGAVPVRPPIGGLDQLGPADGVHLLHSMGDTFGLTDDLEQTRPTSALIVGAGYVGLEMAEGLTARGIGVTQVEMLPEVLPTVDPELGALVRAELVQHGVTVHTSTTVTTITQAPAPGCTSTGSTRQETLSAGTSTWSWSWSGSSPTATCSPGPAPRSGHGRRCWSTSRWPPACRGSGPPGTVW